MDLDVGFLLALCGLRGCGGGWLVVDGGGCSCGDDDTCAFILAQVFCGSGASELNGWL